MFTGIVETIGVVRKAQSLRNARRIIVKTAPSIVRRVLKGGSIAIDGVCLTRLSFRMAKDLLTFELMDSTLRRTTLGAIKVGERVNLETAMTAGQPIGGHFLSGHVDGVGVVQNVVVRGYTRYLEIKLPRELVKYIVPQGSVAINGVSLTVVETKPNRFSVALTFYTQKHTNLGALRVGSPVNLEVDMFAKYILKHLEMYEKISHRRRKV